MSAIKDYYFNKYNVDKQLGYDNSLDKSKSGILKGTTELCGDNFIKFHNLFFKLFPNCDGYRKIRDTEKQKLGIDYEIYIGDTVINIDLKCCIGEDYSMFYDDFIGVPSRKELGKKAIPIEIFQYGKFNDYSDRLTDYILYVILDKTGEYFYLIDFNKIKNLTFENKEEKNYKHYTSFNGTGVYIKYPILEKKEEL